MTEQIRQSATARANPNIAFIKYWGNIDHRLRLPANPSLSMNLAGLYSETTVIWDDRLATDELILNGHSETGRARDRVMAHLDALRERTGIQGYARVTSANNFPTGAGIASSASAFAALTLAATAAAGLKLPQRELTRLARLGSGSAARSIPDGFVEWHAGGSHEESFAVSIAPPAHWDLVDVIAVVSREHKTTGSEKGHRRADTSDLQAARVAGAADRLAACKRALLSRDFAAFAEVVERDSNLMHTIMMTSRPPLFYWLPATLDVMTRVREWRREGLQVCYTLDAGPNIHCICVRKDSEHVSARLKSLSGVMDVLVAGVGGGARLMQA